MRGEPVAGSASGWIKFITGSGVFEFVVELAGR